MADLALNDAPVLRATIARPRIGVWHADLVLDTDVAPSARATLATADGALRLEGTVVRAEAVQGRVEARVAGGAAALGQVLAPRFYRGVPLRIPLTDLLRDAGETLSATADPEILDTQFAQWVRDAAPAGVALAHLLNGTGAAWRVLPDGTLWVGRERWPTLEVPGEVLEQEPVDGNVVVGTDTLEGLLEPGTTWLGQRVSYVEHHLEHQAVRTRVWFERTPTPTNPVRADRMRSPIDALVEHITRTLRFHALFPAAVLAQDADGTLQVQADSELLPPMVGVPIRRASPGATLRVARGARVLLAFEGADPGKPIAILWTGDPAKLARTRVHAEEQLTLDAATIHLGDGASRGAARADDTIAAGTLAIAAAPAPGPPGAGTVLTFTYADGLGRPQPPVAIALVGLITGSVLPGAAPFALGGKITSASTKTAIE